MEPIRQLMARVNQDSLREMLYHLACDPLPMRKVNYTRPGQPRHSLDEADAYITGKLESWGYQVEKEGVPVQAFRCDTSKPKASQYSPPAAEDPWHTAWNLYARKKGTEQPDEIIVVVSHKDSQSWVDSPGAYDNASGTVGNLEIARSLSDYEPRRSLWFLYCNEEHKPWTSVTAAQRAAERNDNIIAVLNIDSIGGKSQDSIDRGEKTNVTRYVTPEGEKLADLMIELNERLEIGLKQGKFHCEHPNDDDGSFIKAGFAAAVAQIGSFPYADPNYHRESDTADKVDVENVALAAQLSLAGIVHLDQNGFEARL